ncbi:S8/S53 family peptidase [Flavobacterium selenitireducens]|uniref:S8/S53 family peptidase n=1 Tax=Flavobacterium selenitireducens TaxID=2722704 RepID=UPI00168B4C8F|nr:S8/S53 family peptidase [Flavobacterium selenitireducens]MBD3582450.1 S8 family serine peptidase [Flavobacterium selenitireducens]
MNRIFTIFFALFFAFGFAQDRKNQFRLRDPMAKHELFVAFSDAGFDVSRLASEYGFTLEKWQAIPGDKLDNLARNAADGGKSANALRLLYKVRLPNADNPRLLELAKSLESLASVRYCIVKSESPIPPPNDIPPTTPNYVSQQTYIQSNPGVNMQVAWNMGLTGSGIKVRDVEYGFNKNHEEFNSNPNIFMQAGAVLNEGVSEAYSEHGTAVVGILAGDDGAYGVTGMVHGISELVQYPEWTTEGFNPSQAVASALADSSQGDVIILEMQEYGINDQFVPAEYDNLIWDLTQAAIQSGILVVAAAGNGNVNLNAQGYEPYMQRGDSGAILVGAGTADINHDKISYSTYGSRINLQAWGTNIRTTGYGNFAQIGGDFNQRYTTFSGTSAATPVVASCAIALQSYYHELTGTYLSPLQVRQILTETGIAQGVGGHIGPIPNMEAALAAVAQLSTDKVKGLAFAPYPNPARTTLSVSGQLSDNAKIEIVDTVGKLVLVSSQKTMDVSALASGIYFVKISDDGKSGVKRFVKI